MQRVRGCESGGCENECGGYEGEHSEGIGWKVVWLRRAVEELLGSVVFISMRSCAMH
jgi:hypothetical protein